MTLVKIDIRNVASETHPDDRVLIRSTTLREASGGGLISTAETSIPLVDGVGEVELAPGPVVVNFQCRGISDVGDKRGIVPDEGTVDIAEVIEEGLTFTPPVVNRALDLIRSERDHLIADMETTVSEAVDGQLGTAVRSAQSAATTAAQAATSADARATSAESTVNSYTPRVVALEALGGLSAESPVDGQTANLIGQPNSLSREAVYAVISSTDPGVVPAAHPRFGRKDEDPATHRPAIQAALDEAKILSDATGSHTWVDLGSYEWILTSKTLDGTDDPATTVWYDIILAKPPRVNIIGNRAVLRVVDNFGRYGNVIKTTPGFREDEWTYVGGFEIDFNARGGNVITRAGGSFTPEGSLSPDPKIGVQLSGLPGSDTTIIHDVVYRDADSLNCCQISAKNIIIPEFNGIDIGLNAVEWHDHSTSYTTVNTVGGTQKWGNSYVTGGGLSSHTALEIHGGRVTMGETYVERMAIVGNFCGSQTSTDIESTFTATKIVSRETISGVSLWSTTGSNPDGTPSNSGGAGGLTSVDLNLDLRLSRDWYPDDIGDRWAGVGVKFTGGGGTTSKSYPILGGVKVRGRVAYDSTEIYLPNNEKRSCAITAVFTDDMVVHNLDAELEVINPWGPGMYLVGNFIGGRINLRVTNPGTTPGLDVPGVLTGAFRTAGVLSGNFTDMSIHALLVDTRTPRISYGGIIPSVPVTMERCDISGDVKLSDTTSPFTFFMPSTATQLSSTVVHQRSIGWQGIVSDLAVGSTHTDIATGTVRTQKQAPSGRVYRTPIVVATTEELEDASHHINTVDKVPGSMVYNTDTRQAVYAYHRLPATGWYDASGVLAHTVT